MEAKNLADLYHLPLLDWDAVESQLHTDLATEPGSGGPDRYSCWLSSVNPDGSPHVTGVGALWDEGAFWVTTGAASRKGRNLARDPRCALSAATRGYDVVVEGVATRVTDPEVVARLAAKWAEGGWPCRVDESGTAITAPYSAPSAGPPPWAVYRIEVRAATAVGTSGEGGATHWTF